MDDNDSGTPRWVWVIGLVVLVVVLVFVAVMLVGGGDHGPSRHVPLGGSSESGSTTSGSKTLWR
ncbi:MAG: hypothetical protein ACRDT4_09635 [Micromonosporaceae bacterium]